MNDSTLLHRSSENTQPHPGHLPRRLVASPRDRSRRGRHATHGGLGIGVDKVYTMLIGASIREMLAFPYVRPFARPRR